jgi:hypothetical protein
MDFLLIGGASLYGKVDRVPGWFYVKTQFLHLNFLPLIPQQSFLILEGSEKQTYVVGAPVQYKGVAIPLCRRSVTFAWVRHACAVAATFLFVLAGVGALVLINPVGTPEETARLRMLILVFGLSASALVLLGGLTWACSDATPDRAVELCRLTGIDPHRLRSHFRDNASRQRLETLLGPTPSGELEIDSPLE